MTIHKGKQIQPTGHMRRLTIEIELNGEYILDSEIQELAKAIFENLRTSQQYGTPNVLPGMRGFTVRAGEYRYREFSSLTVMEPKHG